MGSYRSRIDIIGNRIEGREYELPIFEGYRKKGGGGIRGEGKEKEKNQKKSARRAKEEFVERCDSSFAFIERKFPQLLKKGWRLRFLTLTYREEMVDRDRLSKDWERFIKRLKTYFVARKLCLSEELQFLHSIAVPEIQHRRAIRTGKKVWHLHVLIFSPFLSIRGIYKVWGAGGILPKKIDMRRVTDIGGYLAKYMEKDFDEELFNKKRFFSSRNVRNYKVRWAQGVQKFAQIMKMFARYAVKEKNFIYQSEHLGLIIGCSLVLARSEEVWQFLKIWIC